MSWEALRLTSRTPSEVYRVLGPHGVEELLTKARDACWREMPEEQREFKTVRQRYVDVFERNMKVWQGIRKPTPEAFFSDLLPHVADGHVRQALVLTWMMMPRTGGREFKETIRIAREIFNRILTSWDADNDTFTTGKRGKARPKPAAKKPTVRKVAKKAGKKRAAK